MVQCANGSQVKAGAPTAFWAGGLPFINYLSSRLSAFAAFLGTLFPDELFITANFCAQEPPAIPAAPTLSDYATALVNPGHMGVIYDYWKASYLNAVWPTYCECRAGGSPAGSLEAWMDSQGPLFFWHFDDAAGLTLAKDYADSNNGGYFSAYTLNAPKIAPNAAGNCVNFGGGGINVHSPGAGELLSTTGAFTYVGFFKLNAGADADLWNNYDGTHPQRIEFYVRGDGKCLLQLVDSTNTVHNSGYVGSGLSDGNTHLMVCIVDEDAGTYQQYVDNGVLVASGTFPANAVFYPPSNNLFIGVGATSGAGPLGSYQDFAIYRHHWTQDQVKAAYFNAGLGGASVFVPPTPTPPVGGPTSAPPGFPGSDIAAVLAALNVLEQKLDNLIRYGSVTTTPSIALHTVHAGMTGAFSLPSVGLVGVVVDITTVPTRWGRTTETPARYIPRLGQLALEYAAEFGVPRDLDLLHSLIIFPPGPVDTIQFTLEPGIVATVTEVVRGP